MEVQRHLGDKENEHHHNQHCETLLKKVCEVTACSDLVVGVCRFEYIIELEVGWQVVEAA